MKIIVTAFCFNKMEQRHQGCGGTGVGFVYVREREREEERQVPEDVSRGGAQLELEHFL